MSAKPGSELQECLVLAAGCRQLEEFHQVGFVDGGLTAPQSGDLLDIGVYTGNSVAQVRQTGPCYGTDVPRANNCDSHG